MVISAIAGIGLAMLYSAANGHADPWMSRQAGRFAVGMAALIAVALVDFRIWLRYAYLLYAIAFLLLLWAGQRTVAGEQRRSDVTAGAFIARVKACRRQPPGPPPSWNACERRVRSNL